MNELKGNILFNDNDKIALLPFSIRSYILLYYMNLEMYFAFVNSCS